MDTSKYTMNPEQLSTIIGETERLVLRSIHFFKDTDGDDNPNSIFNLQYVLAADIHNHRGLITNSAILTYEQSAPLLDRLAIIDEKRKETLRVNRQNIPAYNPKRKDADLGFLR